MSEINPVAKPIAIKLSIFIVVLLVIDFVMRLSVSGASEAKTAQSSLATVEAAKVSWGYIEQDKMAELLAWSDAKPKVEAKPVVVAPTKTETAPAPTPKPPTPEEIRQQVAATISGDKSKFLLGDDLLSLKGLFFDQQAFAVVEIEDVITKQKKYYRANEGKQLGKHQLVSIGKNQVVITNGSKEVVLKMFRIGS